MKSELKQKWLEALRSGEYKQGRRLLHSCGEFCCLGVLCSVAEHPIEKFSVWATLDGYGHRDLVDTGDTGFHWELVDMNDAGKSFAEIADYIEANIPAE